jgi:hypothetical protein
MCIVTNNRTLDIVVVRAKLKADKAEQHVRHSSSCVLDGREVIQKSATLAKLKACGFLAQVDRPKKAAVIGSYRRHSSSG